MALFFVSLRVSEASFDSTRVCVVQRTIDALVVWLGEMDRLGEATLVLDVETPTLVERLTGVVSDNCGVLLTESE